MSSFLHSAKHFNSIEKSLIELKRNNRNTGFCYGIGIFEIEHVLKRYREFSSICVHNQYKSHYKDVEKEIRGSYLALQIDDTFTILNPIELYKAMISMEYQIEFEYMNRDFTDTEKIAIETYGKIKNELSYLIINSLPEYDSAKGWSI